MRFQVEEAPDGSYYIVGPNGPIDGKYASRAEAEAAAFALENENIEPPPPPTDKPKSGC